MKKGIKLQMLALFLVAALCVPLLSAPAAATTDVYFMSVNDNLLPLNEGTMPAVINGSYYIPYTLFSSSSTGVSLGVSCSYNKSTNTLTIYNLRQTLVFDQTAGNSRNQHTGDTYDERAITRNGISYVPLIFVCSFFDLSYSISQTDYGVLLRVTNSDVVLTDIKFVDAASALMSSRLRDYTQSQTPAVTTSPNPGSESEGPAEEEPVDTETAVKVYLAFQCETGEELSAILDVLDNYNKQALFLLPVETLAANDDLVRRMIGSGHSIGLVTNSGNLTTAVEELAEGNRLLQSIARTRAHIVTASNAVVAQDLASLGWAVWAGNINGIPTGTEAESMSAATHANKLLSAVGRKSNVARVTMDNSTLSTAALSTFLRLLNANGYTVRLALETELL